MKTKIAPDAPDMPPRARTELVIFDCDGVLVDSEPISNRVLAKAIGEAGLNTSAEEVARRFEGMRLRDIQVEVERQLGRSLPSGWLTTFERRRAAELAAGLDSIPGIADALDALRRTGLQTCVASQASLEKVELVLGLAGLAERFQTDALFSSRMVERGKPHPDLFLLAASSMGVRPARCVVVEDGTPGVHAARLAGMRVLGYAPDEEAGERLGRAGATTFGSMADLPGLLGLPRS
jgi:HAD superfamily hydrolase (TIGR01509 family)